MTKTKNFAVTLTFTVLLAVLFIPNPAHSEKGQIGLGYDEGIAARYFFSDAMGLQFNLAYERLGGYDPAPGNNDNGQNPENNFGVGIGLLYNLFNSDYIYLDALGQFAFAHDGTENTNGVGDRDRFFFRVALAPEILIGNHLGLGMRMGFEIVHVGDSEQNAGGGNTESTDDAHTNIRFYGPENPFDGAVLGLAIYVYFGG